MATRLFLPLARTADHGLFPLGPRRCAAHSRAVRDRWRCWRDAGATRARMGPGTTEYDRDSEGIEYLACARKSPGGRSRAFRRHDVRAGTRVPAAHARYAARSHLTAIVVACSAYFQVAAASVR